jgi:hypothetical protein
MDNDALIDSVPESDMTERFGQKLQFSANAFAGKPGE